SIRLPSRPTISCPAFSPACSAGEPGFTNSISAPRCARGAPEFGGGRRTPSDAFPLVPAPLDAAGVSTAGGTVVCGVAIMPELRGAGSVGEGDAAPVGGRSEGAAPDGAGPGGVSDGGAEPGAEGDAGATVVGAGVTSAGFEPEAAVFVPRVTDSGCDLPSRTIVIVIKVFGGRLATASYASR